MKEALTSEDPIEYMMVKQWWTGLGNYNILL